MDVALSAVSSASTLHPCKPLVRMDVALSRYKKIVSLSLTRASSRERGILFFCSACRNAQKRTVPKAPMSSKTVLSVRDQGLEPWTP